MANGRFAMPIPLRRDFQASQLRLAARCTKDGPQTRRLLALAAIYEGATRSEAAPDRWRDAADRDPTDAAPAGQDRHSSHNNLAEAAGQKTVKTQTINHFRRLTLLSAGVHIMNIHFQIRKGFENASSPLPGLRPVPHL